MLPVSNSRQMSRFEVLLVVVALSGLAVIAIPRMSRGSDPPADGALTSHLRTLRNALELYAFDHQGAYPPPDQIVAALTMYSDDSGTSFAPQRDDTQGIRFGPYLRAIPPLPVPGVRFGCRGIASRDAPGVGWIYCIDSNGTGSVRANTDRRDSRGVLYASY